MKRIIDLTHTISEEMPVYPGTEGPTLKPACGYDSDGFKETLLTMFSHTGTHMDAPAHLYPGRATLDSMPVESFWGSGIVIHCTGLSPGERIRMGHIDRNKADGAEFLLFNTGWHRLWGKPEYFKYPYIDDEVADYIIASGKKGLGLDVIGVDPVSDTGLRLHRRLFAERDIVVVENLANLQELGSELFTFMALPLKYANADGAPVRAVAVF